MKLCMAQINTFVGDWHGNRDRILEVCRSAHAEAPDSVVVFPELTLSGYPPEDLLLRPSLTEDVERTLAPECAPYHVSTCVHEHIHMFMMYIVRLF